MTISRRNILKRASAVSLLAHTNSIAQTSSLPDKKSFEAMGVSYINSASQHPISLNSSKAAERVPLHL
jgi:hypothetical protein